MPRRARKLCEQRRAPSACKSISSTPPTKTKRPSPTFVKGAARPPLRGAAPSSENRRPPLTTWAAPHARQAFYVPRQYVTAGGLASYGTSFAETYRQAGSYVGKILSGAKP